jgi:hypothetical protein
MPPGDSARGGRPVAGAAICVLAVDGTEVATLRPTPGAPSRVPLDPGDYRLLVEHLAGIVHSREPLAVTVGSGSAKVTISCDTRIR